MTKFSTNELQIKQTKATLKDVTDEYDKIEKLPKVGDWIEQMKDDLQTKYDIKRSVDKKRLIQKYVDSVFVTLEKDKGLTHKEYKILLLLKITTNDMMLTKKDKQQTYSYQILDSNNLNDISYDLSSIAYYFLEVTFVVKHCKSTT